MVIGLIGVIVAMLLSAMVFVSEIFTLFRMAYSAVLDWIEVPMMRTHGNFFCRNE